MSVRQSQLVSGLDDTFADPTLRKERAREEQSLSLHRPTPSLPFKVGKTGQRRTRTPTREETLEEGKAKEGSRSRGESVDSSSSGVVV